MSTIRLDPPPLSRAPHFSQGVLVDAPARILHIAGQTAGGDAVHAQDFDAQVNAIWDSIEVVLASAGMTLADLIKTTGFITDRANVAAYRATYLRRLGDIRPASTLVVCALVHPALLVEIEAVAAA